MHWIWPHPILRISSPLPGVAPGLVGALSSGSILNESFVFLLMSDMELLGFVYYLYRDPGAVAPNTQSFFAKGACDFCMCGKGGPAGAESLRPDYFISLLPLHPLNFSVRFGLLSSLPLSKWALYYSLSP